MTLKHGEVASFKVQNVIDLVTAYIDAEEVERALWILNNLPAFYRDHKIPELESLKGLILSKLITAHGYMSSSFDADVCDVIAAEHIIKTTLRGRLAKSEIERHALHHKVPHIVDMGPGEYWLPIALKDKFKFSYFPIHMDKKAFHMAASYISTIPTKPLTKDAKKVFFALEVIEHISEPQQIVWEALKHCGEWPHVVHLSTPCYTYDARPKDWQTIGLPHLRAYTPGEFHLEASKLFPGYKFTLYLDRVMSLRGERWDSVDEEPLKID